jgi:hypothetical protein
MDARDDAAATRGALPPAAALISGRRDSRKRRGRSLASKTKPIWARAKEWEAARDAKVSTLGAAMEARELAECTFAPVPSTRGRPSVTSTVRGPARVRSAAPPAPLALMVPPSTRDPLLCRARVRAPTPLPSLPSSSFPAGARERR